MAMIKSVAHRNYVRRMALFMGSYIFILLGVVTRFKNGGVVGVEAYVLGVLPALPIIGVFWAIGRLLIEEKDEFLRMLMVRQMIVATGFALTICAVHGFLSSFDVLPRTDLYWAPVLWFAGLGVGAAANRVQFGTAGNCA